MQTLMPSRWQVPEVFRRRLGEKVGRQRLMLAEGHLLLVLHRPPKPQEDERQARLFWRNPLGDWQSGDGGAGLGDFKEHVLEYDRVVERIEKLLRGAPTAETYYQVLHEVTPLLRAAGHLSRVLQQAREAISEDRHILLARDEAGDVERNLELLHAEALHGLQFLVAQRSEQQARQGEQLVTSSQRLNLLMALCLPMTALASVLGMNLRNGMERQGEGLFWAVLTAAVVLGFVVMTLVAAPVKPKPPEPRPVARRGK